ncbi:hypothetical protein ABDB91_11205 [Desulfoscipio sp. XC116]
MGNVVNVEPEKAGMDLIGKKVIVGHQVVNGMNYTSGEGVTPTFSVM